MNTKTINTYFKIGFLINLIFLVITGLSGCASTTQILPRVTEEKPTLDKALIIVERGLFAGSTGFCCNVYDNNTLVGSLGQGGKLAWLRDPGPMDIQYEDWWMKIGRRLAVTAGEKYYYKIEPLGMDGLGIPINNNMKLQPTLETPLVFFRVLYVLSDRVLFDNNFGMKQKNFSSGILSIQNILDSESKWYLTVSDNAEWMTVYLPVGEYYISEFYLEIGNTLKVTTITIPINAKFAVNRTNAGIYIGDLMLSEEKYMVSIQKDSEAARLFLEKDSKDWRKGLPYTESMMVFKK